MGGGLYVVEHCDRDRARILARGCHVGPITPGVELKQNRMPAVLLVSMTRQESSILFMRDYNSPTGCTGLCNKVNWVGVTFLKR